VAATDAVEIPPKGGNYNELHRVLRYSSWDGVLIALSFAYAGLLLSAPSIPLIAIGLWWTANTVAHNFIHTPFFKSRVLNRSFSLFLSALMGIPQSLWRERHLRHHAELRPGVHHAELRPGVHHAEQRWGVHHAEQRSGVHHAELRPGAHHAELHESGKARHRSMWTRDVAIETAVVLTVWAAAAAADAAVFLTVYVPGYLAGLVLCSLQGHFEHARGTTSHYGWLYNWCFFNDGYHAEHHLRPGEHWTRLPSQPLAAAQRSRWPAVLRWLDSFSLESLERRVLRSPRLQRFVLAAHERAFKALLPKVAPIHRVTIVGGGLYPRSALIVRRLLPDATVAIVDAKPEHLAIASPFLQLRVGAEHGGVELEHRFFDAALPEPADLVVIPLAFVGDRDRIYEHPPAKAVLVHDWMWRRRGEGARVSWLLLKRLNLVTR
jgi:fatty acid desaturase